MPNKFTSVLDAVEFSISTISYFDPIFGEWKLTEKQCKAWVFLEENNMTYIASESVRELFWCFIAELSDQDLQECFPELFSSLYQGA